MSTRASSSLPATEVPATEVSATEVWVDPQVARLTRWSWLSVGLFFVVLVPGAALGAAAPQWLGLVAGQWLGAAGGIGWLVAAGLFVLEVTPVVVGAVLGARATQRGGGALAGSAFAVNVLLVVYALMLQLVESAAG